MANGDTEEARAKPERKKTKGKKKHRDLIVANEVLRERNVQLVSALEVIEHAVFGEPASERKRRSPQRVVDAVNALSEDNAAIYVALHEHRRAPKKTTEPLAPAVQNLLRDFYREQEHAKDLDRQNDVLERNNRALTHQANETKSGNGKDWRRNAADESRDPPTDA